MNAPSKIERPTGVYAKIAAITGDLAKHGIAKTRSANFGKFRGIDDVYNALAPLLSEYGLSVMPRILSRELTERQSKNGNALFYVTVEAEFDFVSADDGSTHTVRTFGEAMDSSDKATNKAMSAAYKYAAFMTFCIPTEGSPDADGETHEVEVGQVSDADWAKIAQLQKATNPNVSALLNHLNIRIPNNDLSKLSKRDAARVIDALETKLARMAKEKSDQKEPA